MKTVKVALAVALLVVVVAPVSLQWGRQIEYSTALAVCRETCLLNMYNW